MCRCKMEKLKYLKPNSHCENRLAILRAIEPPSPESRKLKWDPDQIQSMKY